MKKTIQMEELVCPMCAQKIETALQSNGFGTIGAGRSLFACANAITTYKIGMRFLIHFDGCNICLFHIGEYVKA